MTPMDSLAFYDGPPLWELPEKEVHISTVFTYDKSRAEQLADQWGNAGYDVRIGGPAYNDYGREFVPGRYVKQGIVVTSRGCNNRCWFCLAPRREGNIRELPITDGYILQDNNLLQCSENHIRDVFAMLARQPQRPEFVGGIEAKELKDWHMDLFVGVKPKSIYLAYDTPDDYDPLFRASGMFKEAGLLKNHTLMCYCLCGYNNDTFSKAEARMRQVVELGIMPFAMLYRDDNGKVDKEWQRFQRGWANPFIVGSKMKNV